MDSKWARNVLPGRSGALVLLKIYGPEDHIDLGLDLGLDPGLQSGIPSPELLEQDLNFIGDQLVQTLNFRDLDVRI